MTARVVLIDANSLLYRAFFALPHLSTTRGEPTNAVYGFAVMLYKILEEEKPDYIAAAFDLPTPTFRHRQFSDYKATRERTPDELRSQMTLAREFLEALRIPVFDAEGFEADDLLGALARRAEKEGHEALIVSGDLDLLQVVSENIKALITHRGVSDTTRFDEAAVRERYGLSPAQLVDLKALRGDATDNIPGVPGIGEKTAVSLLQRFGSLEELLANLDKVEAKKTRAALEVFAEQARMSKHLVTLSRETPLQLEWEELRLREPDSPRLKELFQRLEFRGLLRKLREEPRAKSQEPNGESSRARTVQSAGEAEKAAKELAGCANITLAIAAEAGSPHQTQVWGLALCGDSGKAVYVPAQPALLAPFKPLLENERIAKSGHALKEAAIHLRRLGMNLAGISFDSEIASYLAFPLRKNHALWEVAYDVLGMPLPQEAERVGGATLWQDGAEIAFQGMQRVCALQPALTESLSEQGLERLFREIEMPLVPVLADMEMAGVGIEAPYLRELADRLGREIAEAEKQIFILAGEEFAINSPKQLQNILYDKLGLPRGKKIKTGHSTDAATLAGLAEKFEIVARLLGYRELTKLKSTYVDSLPQLVNPRTGRIHPSFNQTVTATGRLSCSDPNLQNIPIRTELGREIRRAFIAGRPQDRLLAADYSQIELRVLAHISGDEALCEVFATDRDLHTATAAELFSVREEEVTSDMRRLAKVVNFSIPYGTTPEGLAQRIKVPAAEARAYMTRYFQRFTGVARYIEEIVLEAREKGYVTTLLGKRRPLPEISSPMAVRRELAERMAVNTPIQGSAADIMKLAMLEVVRALEKANLATKMILQVHDELVFEGPEEELVKAAAIVKEKMEGACELRVPLKVGMESGQNWRDLEPL